MLTNNESIFNTLTQAIVNPVNCMGVMGAGLALLFKQRYPANYVAYTVACEQGLIKPGLCYTFATGALNPQYIVNFPTKRHWRAKSLLEDIDAGLRHLRFLADVHQWNSIAMPRLGCGLGGLKWDDVRPLVERHFKGAKCQVIVYFGKTSKQYL